MTFSNIYIKRYKKSFHKCIFVNIGKFRRKKHYTNNKFQYIKMHAKYEMVTVVYISAFSKALLSSSI